MSKHKRTAKPVPPVSQQVQAPWFMDANIALLKRLVGGMEQGLSDQARTCYQEGGKGFILLRIPSTTHTLWRNHYLHKTPFEAGSIQAIYVGLDWVMDPDTLEVDRFGLELLVEPLQLAFAYDPATEMVLASLVPLEDVSVAGLCWTIRRPLVELSATDAGGQTL